MAYDIDTAKELVLRAGLELSESGLIARTWGNISARISEDEFVITPSGRGYDSLTPDDLVVINIHDLSYEGDIKPSSEKGVHAEAYRIHRRVNFVIHTHQTDASAISILGEKAIDIRDMGEEVVSVLGPRIVTAGYGLSSTKKLTQNVADAMGLNQDCTAVLMKNHGALCLGADYEGAFRVAHVLEKVCGEIYREYCGDVPETEGPELEVVSCDESGKTILHSRSPYTLFMSTGGKKMSVYLDDLGQMVGTGVPCLKAGAEGGEISKALAKSPMVLVQGEGAYTSGVSYDEAEACAIVLEKGAKAACLGKLAGKAPVDRASALLEHAIYVKKYSKLK